MQPPVGFDQQHIPSPSGLELAEQQATALLVLDQQRRVLYANAAAESILGCSRRQLLGGMLDDWVGGHPLKRTHILKALLTGQRFQQRDRRIRLRSGAYIMVDLSISLFEAAPPRLLLEFIPSAPSLEVEIESEALAQHQQTRAMMRYLAHEIRNPLGGLRGAAQLLSRQIDPSGKAFVEVILREADRLGTLVDSVLGRGKPETRKLVNVHQLLEQALELLTIEQPATIHIRRDYDPSLPELSLYRASLYQALLNVLKNALQALGDHGGELLIRTRAASNILIGEHVHRLTLRLDITDTGPGIPSAVMARLFTPLNVGRAGGNGLGLSISRDAIAQQGGSIRCSSQPGATQFTIHLPVLPHD